jgi:hypothetical protein
MRVERFLLPVALLLSVSIPVTSSAVSPPAAEWIQYDKLTAAPGAFGYSVALSGNTAS